jgi:frataxin-like iron-binding protein CyaY
VLSVIFQQRIFYFLNECNLVDNANEDIWLGSKLGGKKLAVYGGHDGKWIGKGRF